MTILDDNPAWYSSADSARWVPDGAIPYDDAGPCCDCGHYHDGYEPDELSPCGHYHSEECPGYAPGVACGDYRCCH